MNWRIVSALVKKEMFQIVRDPSSILIAFILPVILLFLFVSIYFFWFLLSAFLYHKFYAIS